MVRRWAFPRGPLGTIGYVLADGSGEAVVIDAPPGLEEDVRALVVREGIRPRLLLNTHGHFDHVAANAALQEGLGMSLCCHRADQPLLQEPVRAGFVAPFPCPPSRPDGTLEEGDRIAVGDLELRVLAVPGHTPGGVAFLLEREGMLFTGDTLFAGTCGRTDLWGGDERALKTSLRRLSELAGDLEVLPGHGPATRLGAEKGWIARWAGGEGGTGLA